MMMTSQSGNLKMPSPKIGYRTADGEPAPSVTTIISRFKDSGGLVHWAWDLGTKGKDYRDEREAAATSGTMAHTLVEQWVRGQTPHVDGDPGLVAKAQKCFGAFLEWATQSRLKVTHAEVGLVSERHRYGGTLDAIIINDRRAIGDWKTSGRLYPEYLVQLAAYGHLWDEAHPSEQISGGFHLARFDKRFGDFHHHWWPELDRAWEAFLHMRALYDIDKELKDRVG